MDSESKKLLEETFELSKENNKLLHRVRRVQKMEAFFRVLKIVLILGVAFGSFYFLEPYLNKLMDTFSQISGVKQTIDRNSFGDVLKKI